MQPPGIYRQSTMCMTIAGNVSFFTPSSAALHLNSAWKAARRAVVARGPVGWNYAPARFRQIGMAESATRQLKEESASALFDYLEDAMLAATSSFSAIEAFCNTTIVGKSSGPIQVKRKKAYVAMTSEEVEEFMGTDEKLKRLLPALLGVPTPAGKAIWDRYKRLKQLRDSITHFKRRDLSRAAKAEPTALHDLVEADPLEFPEIAIEVVRYFFPQDPPRWLLNPAWGRVPSGGETGG